MEPKRYASICENTEEVARVHAENCARFGRICGCVVCVGERRRSMLFHHAWTEITVSAANGPEATFTVEQLFQAFKERLMKELVVQKPAVPFGTTKAQQWGAQEYSLINKA